jgi:hypothetical protein
MRIKSFFALISILSIHLSAQANVLYQWQSLDNNLPNGITLNLVFTDAAVASGSASFHLLAGDWAPAYPDSPLVSLYYSVPGINAVTYLPQVEKFNGGFGRVDLDVNFSAQGFLTGFLSANNSVSNVEIRSTGNIFTVIEARSDQGMTGAGCSRDQTTCNGATGYLLRSGEVPEPGTLGLALIGIAAGAILRRRRSGAT